MGTPVSVGQIMVRVDEITHDASLRFLQPQNVWP